MCAGSKAAPGEGDQGGRAKGSQNNQQRQGQDPNLLPVQANEAGDSKKFAALFQKMYELGKKLGPEYAALIDGLQDIDPEAEVGQEISSTLDALDNLCGG
jgi:hypothetical protein